jgi:hypothetical protein
MILADIHIHAEGQSDVEALLSVFAYFWTIGVFCGVMLGCILSDIREARERRRKR